MMSAVYVGAAGNVQTDAATGSRSSSRGGGGAGKKRPGPPSKAKAITKAETRKAAAAAASTVASTPCSSYAAAPGTGAGGADHFAAVEADAARIAAKNVERNARIKALQRDGLLADIEPILCEVLAERRHSLGAQHPDTLKSISTLGRLLQVQGKLAEAKPLFEEALAGRRSALGPRHPYTLNSV
jgi:hypothetical protein